MINVLIVRILFGIHHLSSSGCSVLPTALIREQTRNSTEARRRFVQERLLTSTHIHQRSDEPTKPRVTANAT
ncbi:hypothetical protein KC19_2G108300 [Ceratodon purpureus]|uniref:Secreted protein n=1 Tax=Ceratodon purpureus TaxID=3225 RepID=A0A8T0ISI0_CERPU|nr:hypothetical protein KC19_2G108300 [Ceratodon purpureus]